MTTLGKRNILDAARILFGEKGFEGASMREISKRAHVNVAMIAYYFGCKEDLYLSCLGDFAQEQAARISGLLQAPRNKADFQAKLHLFVQTMMDGYETNGPLIRILMREMNSDKKKVHRSIHDLTSPFFDNIRNFFAASIEAGIIPKEKSADLITVIFLGALSHPIQAEVPLKRTLGTTLKDPEFRKKYSDQLLSIFINGVLA